MGEAVGEGVDIGAEDAAVVADEADGTRRGCLAGVENDEELNDPSERSGCVPADWVDVSAAERMFNAADIAGWKDSVA